MEKIYPKVVAVGHLCMDKISICEDFPRENTSKHILSYSQHPGGTACQAMVTLCRLGESAGYMSPLGDDEAGKSLYADCVKEGLDMSLCRIVPGVVTHFTNVLVNEKSNTRTFLSYHGKFQPMTFGSEERDYIAHASILHLDNTRNDNALAAARIARENGVLVSLDGSSMSPDNSKNIELVSMTDILITNETFPTRLTGIADRREALMAIGRTYAPRVLISTGGEAGCIAWQDGELVDYPAYSVRSVDTTGAGDNFHGAFLFGLLRGYDFAYNIRFASAVAAMSCLAVGGRDGIPRLDEALAFMQTHPFGCAQQHGEEAARPCQ